MFPLYLKFSQVFEQQKSQLAIYLLHCHRILSYQLFDTSSLGLLVVEMFPLVYPLYFSVIFYLIFLVFINIQTLRKSNFS